MQQLKQAQKNTLYYPAIWKPCLDHPYYQITEDLDACTDINRNDLFWEKDYYSQGFGLIDETNVNVRKGPGNEYEKIGTVEITYRVSLHAYEMDSKKVKWYLISSVQKEIKSLFGWVNGEYVSIPSDFVEPVKIIPAKIEFRGIGGIYECTFNADGTCFDTYDTKPEYGDGGRISREGKIFRHKDLIWCRQKKLESREDAFFYFRDGKYHHEFIYQGLD